MVWYMIPVVRQRSGKVPPRNEREESNPERSEGGGYCRKTPNRQTHRTAPQDLVGLLPQVNPPTLKTAEEVFGNGVIVGITSAGHALADTIGHQPFLIEALDAYCTPQSLWKISPFGGLRRRYAISRAASASCVSIRPEILNRL